MRTPILVLALATCLLMTSLPAGADPEAWEPDDQDNTWTQVDDCLMVDYSKSPPVYWYQC